MVEISLATIRGARPFKFIGRGSIRSSCVPPTPSPYHNKLLRKLQQYDDDDRSRGSKFFAVVGDCGASYRLSKSGNGVTAVCGQAACVSELPECVAHRFDEQRDSRNSVSLCASYLVRKRALYNDMSRYTCCAGYMPCSGKCRESSCPEFCLCTEGFMLCLQQLACIFSIIAMIVGGDEIREAFQSLKCLADMSYCT